MHIELNDFKYKKKMWTSYREGMRICNTNHDHELWIITHPDGKFHTVRSSFTWIKNRYP